MIRMRLGSTCRRVPVLDPVNGSLTMAVAVGGESPTGWWIIGRSPTAIPLPDRARPFLVDVGDRVRFRRIGRAACQVLAPQVPHG